MEVLQIIIFFTFLLIQITRATNSCKPQFCVNKQLIVRFPFQIQNQQSHDNCGYPGFNLSCIGNKPELVLTIPNSGDFIVRDINYALQEIKLSDPNGCLPRRLMSLNLSSSPFTMSYSQKLTFLSCPPVFATRSGLSTVDCLSNSTTSIVAASPMNLVRDLNNCTVMDTLAIPVSWQQGDEWLANELNQSLRLAWNVPNCVDCEASGRICGFQKISNQTFCFKDPGKDKPSAGKISELIALYIVIPAIACSLGVGCLICNVESRHSRSAAQNSATEEAIEIPADSIISGLDDTTIESYTKVVLGESRRLPGPNGAACPICLVDYDAKDTVRFIPLCEHCFHSECIDEWLKMNGTCPICWISPSPARVNT